MDKKDPKQIAIQNIDKQLGNDNQLCRFLIEDLALPVVFLSLDGVITYANQSFAKMIGYSPSEVIDKDVFMFIDESYQGESKKRILTDIIKGQCDEEKAPEIQFRKKSGELGWVALESLTCNGVSDDYERVILCVLRDITREKEQQVEKDNLHGTTPEQAFIFQNLVENLEAHIVIKKIDNTIVWANKLFLELYDSSLEGMIGKTELNLWSVEDAKKIEDARNAVIQNKERNTIELFIEHKAKKFTVLMTLFPIFNESGVVEYIGEIKYYNESRAITTEHKWVCTGPLCTRRMLSGFFDNATNPIYAIDIDGRFIAVNQSFADIYGVSIEEINGKNKEEVDTTYGIKENELIREADHRVVKLGRSVVFECDIPHLTSKKMMHINYNKFPLYSFNGEIYGTGTIMTDITQTIEQQAELEMVKEQSNTYMLKAKYHEYLLQSYMDNMPHYASIIDLEGNLEFINKYALNLWGETKENVINKHYTEFVKNDRFLIHIAQDMEFVKNEHKPVENEESFDMSDNNEHVFFTNMFPMFNNNGLLFAIGVFRVDITDRKLVENEREKLLNETQKQQALLRSIMECAPDYISIKDREHRYVLVNPSFAQIMQISAADFIGKDDLELGFPEELVKGNAEKGITGFWADNLLIIESGHTQFIPNEPVAVDGEIRTFCTTKIPLKDGDGKVWGVLTFSRDISRQKELEDELEDRLRILQEVMNHIPQAIFWKGSDLRFIGCNKLFARDAGYTSSDDLIGKTDYDMVWKEYAELYQTDDKLTIDSGVAKLNIEEPLVNAAGEEMWLRTNKIPLKDTSGNIVGLLGTYEDNTEQKRMQETLRQSEENFRMLYNVTPAMLYSNDHEGKITSVSDYWLAVMGYVREEVVGRQLSDFVTKESLQYSREVIWPIFIKNGSCFNVEFNFIKKNGEIFTCLLSAIAQKDSEGSIVSSLEVIVDISELKKKEREAANSRKKLQDNQRLLQDFLDQIPYAITILDLKERIVMLNETYARVASTPKCELIGKHHSEYIKDVHLLRQIEEGNTCVLNNQQSIVLRESMLTPEGEELVFTTHKFPLYDFNEEFSYIGVIVDDITEKINKENELIEVYKASEISKQLLKSFMDNATAAMFAKDENGSYILTNKKKEECIQLATKLDKPNANLLPSEYQDTNSSRIDDARVIAKNEPLKFHDEILLEDGSFRYTETLKFPIYDKNNKLIGVGGITTDITDAVMREKELKEAYKASEISKQFLKSFMDNAATAMFAKDLNGKYILVNKKKEEYLPLKESMLGHTEAESLKDYRLATSFASEDTLVMSQGKSFEFYDSVERENGKMEYYKTLKFPIYDNESKIIAIGGITNDITDTVAREVELEDAIQKAEDAVSSQERFLASMSHDMRTPLNGVVGMINLMEQTSLSTEQKEYLEAMKVSSYNLRVLINDILDISKIQAGKLNIECVLFDLNEILISINNVFTPEASRKGVLFSIELSPDTPTMVEGDPSRLNQILNNLIGNALKFTSEGFVKLKLLYENLMDDKVNIEFVVEDSGIGISEEGLDKLFQPFVQASSDTTRKFGGSGLGLSICKSLVELQQGEIGVSSTLGKGSTFRFNIPYMKAKQERIEQVKQKNNVTEFVSVQPLPPMRCLVFEDNLINQKVAFHTLKKMGVAADMADNGKIGVDILKKNADLYDFALMDIQMPEMDGYEATTVIRNELGLRIPIIAMTASALKGEKERCLEVGMTDFVPKPFVIDELLYVVRKLIKENQNEGSIMQPSNEDYDNKTNNEAIKKAGFGDELLYDMSNVLEMDDPDFTLEILNMFLDTVPKALEELKTGIAQATDWDTVTKVAHKLKGGVGVLQMTEMIKQLQTIELNAKKREDLQVIPEAIDICFRIYEAVKDEIVKLRDEAEGNS